MTMTDDTAYENLRRGAIDLTMQCFFKTLIKVNTIAHDCANRSSNCTISCSNLSKATAQVKFVEREEKHK